jgi:hypothetical protein
MQVSIRVPCFISTLIYSTCCRKYFNFAVHIFSISSKYKPRKYVLEGFYKDIILYNLFNYRLQGFCVGLLKKWRYIGTALSVRPSRKINVGYNFAISKYFFMKLSNYIPYNNMLVMVTNSLGQGHF